jgi:tRNA C32,U32 (ribose-2'-O)-methylase TrmJ
MKRTFDEHHNFGKHLKEFQSKNCEKAMQLQEYYHYKVIMIEKQAKQQEQKSMLSTIENNEETDVQILQLVRQMEERINALQFTLNEDTSVKYGQICSEARKTRLLPKHAIKTLVIKKTIIVEIFCIRISDKPIISNFISI